MAVCHVLIPGPAKETGLDRIVKATFVKEGYRVTRIHTGPMDIRTFLALPFSWDQRNALWPNTEHAASCVIFSVECDDVPHATMRKNVNVICDRMREEEAVYLPSECPACVAYVPKAFMENKVAV